MGSFGKSLKRGAALFSLALLGSIAALQHSARPVKFGLRSRTPPGLPWLQPAIAESLQRVGPQFPDGRSRGVFLSQLAQRPLPAGSIEEWFLPPVVAGRCAVWNASLAYRHDAAGQGIRPNRCGRDYTPAGSGLSLRETPAPSRRRPTGHRRQRRARPPGSLNRG